MTPPDPGTRGIDSFRPTSLTDDRLAELRRNAHELVTTFVDPAQLARVESFLSGRHEWACAITGHRFDIRRMTPLELTLLDLAAKAEPEPPLRPRPPAPWEEGYQPTESERAAQALAAAVTAEWQRLRAALPVPVHVAYNYSGPHHHERHLSGAEHIIVQAQLDHARLHRSKAASLCQTPSQSRRLSFEP
jgi:hypothetical protein